jgi:hypothetical protein
MSEDPFFSDEVLADWNRELRETAPLIEGLPPFKTSLRTYREELPPSLDPVGSLAHNNPDLRYHFGSISAWFAEHKGQPLDLSPDVQIIEGQRYLDLMILGKDAFDFKSIKELTEFLQKYPKIDWVIGASWLASVSGGKLVNRLGFTISDIPVPQTLIDASRDMARAKQSPSPRYAQRVQDPEVKFVFASRKNFLTANEVR